MSTSAHPSEVRLTPAEVEALDARRRRGQLLMTISLQTFCVTALVSLLFVGQDLTYSPGWARPMFYWACITGTVCVVTFLAGMRLRRGNYEFTSY